MKVEQWRIFKARQRMWPFVQNKDIKHQVIKLKVRVCFYHDDNLMLSDRIYDVILCSESFQCNPGIRKTFLKWSSQDCQLRRLSCFKCLETWLRQLWCLWWKLDRVVSMWKWRLCLACLLSSSTLTLSSWSSHQNNYNNHIHARF